MIDKIQNIKNVPELRFPEFSGEWVEKKLGDIGIFTGGGTPDTNEKIYWTGDIPWISSSDIQEYNIHSVNISHYITNHAVLKSATKIIPAKSVLIVSRVGVGKFAVVNREICTSQDFTNLTPHYEDVYYLAYYFTAKANRFVRYSQGTSIKGFTSSDIKGLRFNLSTDIREQKKIANFLMQVDKRIDKLEEKKKKLEEYKKGVMQKIFSQEIRFKDDNGEDFPDWEKKRLGDIAKFTKGKNISKSDIDLNGTIQCIRYGELYTFYGEVIDVVKSRTNLTPIDLVFSKANDVIIPASGETQFDIATASCVTIDGIALGGDLNIIRSQCNGIFLSYYLNSEKKNDIANLSQGNSVVHLYGKELKTLSIIVPNIQEQKAISNFLISIDKQIEKISSQIESSKIFKKGLLQKMFV